MDLAALASGLPQATLDAVATTPNGLTTLAQVYVDDQRRTATSDQEAWWLQTEFEPLERGFGSDIWVHRYEVRMSRKDGTRAELVEWAQQMRAHFDGAKPSALSAVTDLIGAEVEEAELDVVPGLENDVELRMLIAFAGKETP